MDIYMQGLIDLFYTDEEQRVVVRLDDDDPVFDGTVAMLKENELYTDNVEVLCAEIYDETLVLYVTA